MGMLIELPSSPRSEPNEAHQKVALVLAALGWQASTSLSNAIECPEDGRTVGLWRFENTSARSPAAAPAGESAQLEAGLGSSARALVERGHSAAGTPQVSGSSALTVKPCESIDPIGEHRSWSPWLQTMPSDTHPSWMRYIALLRPQTAGERVGGISSESAASRASAVLGEMLSLM
ncbi:MAG: hypothetical protein SGPRY_009367 [Prymnesium sp.]